MSRPSPVQPESIRLRFAPRRWPRIAVALVCGALTGVVEFVFLLLMGVLLVLSLPIRWARERALRWLASGCRWLAELERRRLATLLFSDNVGEFRDDRAVRYLLVRAPVGILGGAVCGLVLMGVWAGPPELLDYWSGPESVSRKLLITSYLSILGVLVAYLSLSGIWGVVTADRLLARRFIGPSREEVLSQRVATLATTRAEVVQAVDDERRRIERDLHDGVQQRLVALGLLISRARRSDDPNRRTLLLRQAHDESRWALRDLRDAAWRVYPAALDDGGLQPALEMVASRAAVPVRVEYSLPRRPAQALETAAYFVVSEAVTNAVRHARARSVDIYVGQQGERIVVRVSDDGRGGAVPEGAGLSGLARRVAALDGRFRVDSPAGGPTTVLAELPCG